MLGASHGLSFVIDNNFERHFGYLTSSKIANKQIESDFKGLENEGGNDKKAKIYIDTFEPYEMYGGGKFALMSVKEIAETDEYYRYALENNVCQNNDSFTNCSAREFIRTLQEECGCVPFELLQSIKVY